MWALIFSFLKALLTGELARIWRQHMQAEKAQAIADAPETDKERLDAAEHGDL
jgi:hypothetical protein